MKKIILVPFLMLFSFSFAGDITAGNGGDGAPGIIVGGDGGNGGSVNMPSNSNNGSSNSTGSNNASNNASNNGVKVKPKS